MKRCKKESTTISCEKCPYISNDKSNLNDALECMEMNFPEVMGAFYNLQGEQSFQNWRRPWGGSWMGPQLSFYWEKNHSYSWKKGEFVESSHYSFKKEERTHGFKVKTFIGTPKHYKATIKKQQSLQFSLL